MFPQTNQYDEKKTDKQQQNALKEAIKPGLAMLCSNQGLKPHLESVQ